ncbi:MAG: Bax inhibitor-1/YccA family protein [Acidimicrobiia bacterium]|nr:Bax inhibitor-1/YccA family protein [Acidimicrobiia bacterium]
MANPVLTRQWGERTATRGAELPTQPSIITSPGERMTMGDVMRATGLLFALLFAGAVFGWVNAESISGILLISVLALFGLLILTMVRPQWARVTGPLYAIAEGVLVGAISSLYETLYDGIVVQAILATLAVFAAMLFLYSTRIIKVTERLRSTVVLATAGIALFYVISIVLNLFGVNIPYVWEGGLLSIGISVLIVGVAAFNLLLDFDLIENGIKQGAPGWMSWFAAFGLMVTVVWLYLELLRLISYFSGRD